MKVLVAGDFCDNNRVSEIIADGQSGTMFNGITPLIKASDYRIVNFEFPIVFEESHPIIKWGPNLKGQKESVGCLKEAGFNVCTLANNHILDQGAANCLMTKDLIEKNGIRTVGVGRNFEEASEILYLECERKILAIINCCEHEFSVASHNTAGACPLDPVGQFHQIQMARQNADYVMVIVHGGHEFCQYPSFRMKDVYRFFVDCGADAVVNHHQHCYSGYEIYKGCPIFYGLGNLLFDWNGKRNGSWYEGFLLELTFGDKKPSFELHPYFQCKNGPKVELMQGKDKENFFFNLNRINGIIEDDDKLRQELDLFYQKQEPIIMKVFEPYRRKLFSKLYYMGVLPRFFNGYNKLGALNLIQCESNRDVLTYLLKSKP